MICTARYPKYTHTKKTKIINNKTPTKKKKKHKIKVKFS